MSENKGMNLNLFVFSNIAQFPDENSFYEAISKKYYGDSSLTNLEKDIVRSIYTSANIALQKFWLFKHALRMFLVGVASS